MYLYRFLEAIYINWVSAGWNIDVLDIPLTWWYSDFFFFWWRVFNVKCLNRLLSHKPRDLVWIILLLLLPHPVLFFFIITLIILLLLFYIVSRMEPLWGKWHFLNCGIPTVFPRINIKYPWMNNCLCLFSSKIKTCSYFFNTKKVESKCSM